MGKEGAGAGGAGEMIWLLKKWMSCYNLGDV